MTLNEPVNLPPELGRLSTFIDSHIECLAGSNSELRSTALCATKHIFDWALETEESSKPHLMTLLGTLTEPAASQTRSRTRSATQKRSPNPVHKHQKRIDIQETPLPYLFIEGMNINQIWQQLDLRAARVCENLQVLQGQDEDENTNSEEGSDDDVSEDEDEASEMDVDDESSWEGLSSEEDDAGSTAEDTINLRDEISEDDDRDRGPSISTLDAVRGQQKPRPMKPLSQEHLNLDDNFFDLATFNAETSKVGKEVSGRRSGFAADEESEIDLFGSVDDLETNELFYNDFFEPPLRMQSRSVRSSKVRFHERVSVKKIKAVGKGMPVSSMGDEDSDEEEDDDFDD